MYAAVRGNEEAKLKAAADYKIAKEGTVCLQVVTQRRMPANCDT